MIRLAAFITALLLVIPASADHHAGSGKKGSGHKPAQEDGWTPLLARDLSENWELWFGVPHKTVEVPGYPRSTSVDGTTGEPIGLVDVNNDPLDLVTVLEEDGKPVLRLSGQIYAGLTTKKVYKNYHLSLQFKWGEKKWPPRLNAKRDSGLLLHCTGEHGAFWNVWMADLECQIQEGDCGDLYPLAGTSANVRVRRPEGGGKPKYDVASDDIHRGGAAHSASEEKPNGEWNTVEAYVVEDELVFVVNGTPNMAMTDAVYRGKPLTEGKIQLQSEAAEVFYRNVKIRPITEFPAELREHVRPVLNSVGASKMPLKGLRVTKETYELYKAAALERHPNHDSYQPADRPWPLTEEQTRAYSALNESLHDRIRAASKRLFANTPVPDALKPDDGEAPYFTSFTAQNYDWYRPSYECYVAILREYASEEFISTMQQLLSGDHQNWCIMIAVCDDPAFETVDELAIFSDTVIVNVDLAASLKLAKQN